MLHIVPARDGVEIPEHLMEQTTVTLKISRLFRGRLTISTQTGVEAELLFSNEYFTCKVPFEAVWAVTSSSGQMRMWPEDTPEEILASLAAPAGATSAERISEREAEGNNSGEKGEDKGTDKGDKMSGEKSSGNSSGNSNAKKRPALRRVK